MTGPATPGQEGPSQAPPPLPEGWIAQWDGMSRKYYFVQLSSGVSQWETPTRAAPTVPTPGSTPQQQLEEHPYGQPAYPPNQQQQQQQQHDPELITNANGSQSIRYADGREEPYDSQSERGLGTFAMNQLLGSGKSNNHNQGGLGGLASQFLGGGSSSGHGGSSSSNSSGLVGALASTLLSSAGKQSQPQNNYSGHQQTGGHSSGLMGSLGGMFGGQHSSQNTYGYSSTGQSGNYSGAAPPTSYQPGTTSTSSHAQAPPHQQQQQQHNMQHPGGYGSPAPTQSHGGQPPYGGAQHSYGGPQQQQHTYGGPSPQPPYGGGPPPPHQGGYGGPGPNNSQHQFAPPPSNYGGQPPSSYGGPPSYSTGNLSQPQHHHFQGMHNAEHSGGLYGNPQGGAPPLPMNSHPHQGQGPPPGGYGTPGGYPPPPGPQGGRW